MRKSQRFLAMLLTVVMCFAAVSPLMAFAEDATSRIVTMENFDDGVINTSSTAANVSAAGGFWFDNSQEDEKKGGTYSLENGTLWYTCRRGQLIDIRFYHNTDAQRALLNQIKGQDFILSYRLKSHHDALSMPFTFYEHYQEGTETKRVGDSKSVKIVDGTIVTNTEKIYTGDDGKTITTVANLDYEIYKGQWYLLEIAFLWDANATSRTGEKGAYTHVNLMFNGKVIEKEKLEYAFNQIDCIRIGQESVDECEIDDLTIATGRETLAGVDGRSFDPYTRRTHWIKEADKAPVTDYAYSFAIVGDTQKVSRIDAINIKNKGSNGSYDINDGNRMDTIYEWIVNNVESKKIQYVMGLGDITEYGYGETLPGGNEWSDIEWANDIAAISKMNGVVPYSITRGNHDALAAGVNKYFTDDYKNQFTANTDAAGFFGNQGVANSYRAVNIGGTDYLFVTLNYNPTDAVLEEAGAIIEQYPNHRVIITTHAYMYDNYTTISPDDHLSTTGYLNNDGEGIWNKLIRKYENIFLVMSGHIASDTIQVTQVEGDHGNIVTQMLIDFQVTDAHFGYTGNVVMMYFSADGQEIQVETYSPLHEAYFLEENQFTLNKTLDFNDFSDGKLAEGGGAFNATTSLALLDKTSKTAYTIEDGVIHFTNKDKGYFDWRLSAIGYESGSANAIKQDYKISFDIKRGNNQGIGHVRARDNSLAQYTGALVSFTKNGGVSANDQTVSCGVLPTDRFVTVEIIFHYDPDKINYSVVKENGEVVFDADTLVAKTTVKSKGAFASYTVLYDGEEIGTFALSTTYKATVGSTNNVIHPLNFECINWFRMFNSTTSADFYIDNFYAGYATQGTRKEADKLWGIDFEEDVTELPTDGNRLGYSRVMNSYLPTYTDAPGRSKVGNGMLSLISGGGQSYWDTKFGYDLPFLGDVTLTMQVKPNSTFDRNYFIAMNKFTCSDGTTANKELIQTENGTNNIMINGAKAALSIYRFNTVEVVFRYDYAKMIYKTVELRVNGETIGSMDITSWNCAKLGYFRCFMSWKEGFGIDVDEISVVKGTRTTYKAKTTEFIGYQTTAVEDGLFNLRLVSVLTDADISKYDHLGYNVTATFTYNGQPVTMTMPVEIGRCNKVFTSILATDEMAVAGEITAEMLGGEYIFAVNCMGLPADCDITFDVTTYYQLAGQDTEVAERNFVFTVNSASNANQGGVN